MKRPSTERLLQAFALTTMAAPAWAQPASNHTFQSYDGSTGTAADAIGLQTVNGSGATLFVDFSRNQPATNDFIGVDGDTVQTGAGTFIDQLAPDVVLGNSITWDSPAVEDQTYLLYQYRSVGSAEGFQEFVNYQATRNLATPALPATVPSENGLINRAEWVDQTGNVAFGPQSGTNIPTDTSVYATTVAPIGRNANGSFITQNAVTGTPVAPNTIDFSIADVPASFLVRVGDEANAAFGRNPTENGYGQNPRGSNPTLNGTGAGFSSQLKVLQLEYTVPGVTGSGPGGTLNAADLTNPNDANDAPVGLNFNTDSPTANTVYDTPIAWGPIGPMVNHGTGLTGRRDINGNGTVGGQATVTLNNGSTIQVDEVKQGGLELSNAQHAWVTGRMNNGENLVVSSRDIGSGTRNGYANSIGVDPSFLNGDGDGERTDTDDTEKLGPVFQAGNKGGSSRIEGTIQNHRLGLGYTGLAGGSRQIADNRDGRYEVAQFLRDVAPAGDAVGTGEAWVLPSVDAVVDNADPDTGFAYGGIVSIATLGNPFADNVDYNGDGDFNDPGEAQRTVSGALGSPIANTAARDTVRNIVASAEASDGAPGVAENDLMPGDYLARDFFSTAGLEALPNLLNPDQFQTNATRSTAVANFLKANNDFGAGQSAANEWGDNGSRPFGRVPDRLDLADPNDGFDPTDAVFAGTKWADGTYNDGSTNGDYRYRLTPGGAIQTIAGGSLALNEANAIAGDFNQDGARTMGDIGKMVEAAEAADLLDWSAAQTVFGSDAGGLAANVVIADLLGDFNGDGDFDDADVRYFADGLGLSTAAGLDVNNDGVTDATLNRQEAFTAVDNASGSGNFFGTTLINGTYDAGDSRADIAGNSFVSPGASPTGSDGTVDYTDVDYVYAQFVGLDQDGTNGVEWANLDEAAFSDLSADMNGDLVINLDDVTEVLSILETFLGDVNFSGQIEQGDLDVVLTNWGTDGGYAGGDYNGSGQVEQGDLDIVLSGWGSSAAPDFRGLAVPEPATLALLGLGGLAMLRRRA